MAGSDASEETRDQPSIHSSAFRETGRHIQVYSVKRFVTRARAKMLIDLSAEEVVKLMLNADNSGISRTLVSVENHVVVREDSDEVQIHAEHVARSGPTLMKRNIRLAIAMTTWPKDLSGEYHLLYPGALLKYQGFWSVTPMMNARTADAGPDRISASCAQSLLWIEQDIEPVLSPKANKVPAAVGAILRRVHHNEMQLFLDDLQTVAALRGHDVPLSTILSGNIWGRKGLARLVANKRLRHADASRWQATSGVNAAQQPQRQQQQQQEECKAVSTSVEPASSGKRRRSIHAQHRNSVHERGKAVCGQDQSSVHRAVIRTSTGQSSSERMSACRSFPLTDI